MKRPLFNIERTSTGVIVSISGELNVRCHRELYVGFSSIPEQEDVTISIEYADSIDLYFSQLLYSFSRKLFEEGRRLIMVSRIGTPDRELLIRAGLANLYNISPNL